MRNVCYIAGLGMVFNFFIGSHDPVKVQEKVVIDYQSVNEIEFLVLKKIAVILLIIILNGCTKLNSEQNFNYEKVVVAESELIIDPEFDKEIDFPSFIRIGKDYFLLYEGQLNKIYKYNLHGEKLLEFGDDGMGPGEFQSLTNFWITKNHFLFYDFNAGKIVYYDHLGNFIKEYPIEKNYLSIVNTLLSNNKFVVPANGEEDALLKIVEQHSGEVNYLGEGYKQENSLNDNKTKSMISQGIIPDFMYNDVLLDGVNTDIYSFQKATGNIQKYNVERGLLWQINLEIPYQKEIFDQFVEELTTQDNYLPELSYADGLQATDKGIAILLNVPNDEPPLVAWIPGDGKNISIVEYPNIEKPANFPLRFRLSSENEAIIFVNSLDGEVFKSNWPF